jgi:hypothetical protein
MAVRGDIIACVNTLKSYGITEDNFELAGMSVRLQIGPDECVSSLPGIRLHAAYVGAVGRMVSDARHTVAEDLPLVQVLNAAGVFPRDIAKHSGARLWRC